VAAGLARSSEHDVPPKNNKAEEPEFSESDRAALDHAREELEESRHRAWLWASLGRISKWTLAVIAGVTVVADTVIRILKAWGQS
jgi:hypothetical protein